MDDYIDNREKTRTYKIKQSKAEYVFDVFNYAFLLVLGLLTLYPFLNIISLSLTSDKVLNVGFAASLIPEEFSIASYSKVLASDFIKSGYFMTIVRTVLGTVMGVTVTLMTAYPLSKKYFPHRMFWTMLVVFTMLFSGGLIPSYLLVRNLHLIDNIFALILPGLINTFNMIIVRNYLMTIPDSLEESARIDGANDFIIFFYIILPLSLPIVATISLWIAVSHWNAWFDSLIYTTKPNRLVLQVILRRVLLEGSQMVESVTSLDDMYRVSPEKIKAATIVVTTFPILMTYPFIQKYFIKGIMIGSLKG